MGTPILRIATRWLRHHRRQVTAELVLAALVFTSLGLAVPLPVTRSSSEPYPCKNCSCGCVNAEVCWRDCCCFTQKQKLAWAEINGVIPPAFVFAAVEKPSCCQKEPALPSCCAKRVAKSCHSKPSCCQKQNKPTARPLVWRQDHRRSSTSVILLQALRCQGLGNSWTLLPPAIIPAEPAIGFDEPAPAEFVAIHDQSFQGQLPAPDAPPPKNVA